MFASSQITTPTSCTLSHILQSLDARVISSSAGRSAAPRPQKEWTVEATPGSYTRQAIPLEQITDTRKPLCWQSSRIALTTFDLPVPEWPVTRRFCPLLTNWKTSGSSRVRFSLVWWKRENHEVSGRSCSHAKQRQGNVQKNVMQLYLLLYFTDLVAFAA